MIEIFKVKNNSGAVLSIAVDVSSNSNTKHVDSKYVSFSLYYEPVEEEEKAFTRVWGSGAGKAVASLDTTDILRRELFFHQVKGKTAKEVDSRDDGSVSSIPVVITFEGEGRPIVDPKEFVLPDPDFVDDEVVDSKRYTDGLIQEHLRQPHSREIMRCADVLNNSSSSVDSVNQEQNKAFALALKKVKRTLADTMVMIQLIREEEAAKEREKIAKFGIKRS